MIGKLRNFLKGNIFTLSLLVVILILSISLYISININDLLFHKVESLQEELIEFDQSIKDALQGLTDPFLENA